MKKTLISLGIAIVIILTAIGIVKLMKGNTKNKEQASTRKVPLVEVISPNYGDVNFVSKSTGQIKAIKRFDIVSEVNGQLGKEALNFKEGKAFKKGDLMFSVNSNEYEMGLIAKKSDFITRITSVLADLKYDYPKAYSKWYDYVNRIDVKANLPKIPEATSEKEKFYLVGKGLYSQYYNLKSMEERLRKYQIYAPYDGVVIHANAVGGEAVRPGSKLGTFISTNAFDLAVTYPLEIMQHIKIGTTAKLESTELQKSWTGKVVRIGANIDKNTQSVKVFIRVKGKDLVEGMFLTANVKQHPIKNAITISRKLIDSRNNVFVVENNRLKFKKVEIVESQDDKAIVKGLSPKDKVLLTIMKSAYNGMKVRIK